MSLPMPTQSSPAIYTQLQATNPMPPTHPETDRLAQSSTDLQWPQLQPPETPQWVRFCSGI